MNDHILFDMMVYFCGLHVQFFAINIKTSFKTFIVHCCIVAKIKMHCRYMICCCFSFYVLVGSLIVLNMLLVNTVFITGLFMLLIKKNMRLLLSFMAVNVLFISVPFWSLL